MGRERKTIAESERGNYSTRGCYTIKKKCEHCNHPKAITGCGRTRCAKCRKS